MKFTLTPVKKFVCDHDIEFAIATGVGIGILATLAAIYNPRNAYLEVTKDSAKRMSEHNVGGIYETKFGTMYAHMKKAA